MMLDDVTCSGVPRGFTICCETPFRHVPTFRAFLSVAPVKRLALFRHSKARQTSFKSPLGTVVRTTWFMPSRWRCLPEPHKPLSVFACMRLYVVHDLRQLFENHANLW